MITVTENAAQKAIGLIEREGRSSDEGFGLRMKVVGGGCSGFQYDLAFGESKGNDKVFEFHGLRVFVDPRSTLYLAGSTLDLQGRSDGLRLQDYESERQDGMRLRRILQRLIGIQCGHGAEYAKVVFCPFFVPIA